MKPKLFFAFALVLVPLMALSALAPKDKIHLTPAGSVKIDKLVINDAALIDENRVVIVGRQGNPGEDPSQWPAQNDGVPKGAIVALSKKSVLPFTNLHTTQIWGVSSYGGRVLSTNRDLVNTFLRSWDSKTKQSKEVMKLEDAPSACRVCCFHKSDQVVVDALRRLLVFNPTKPTERLELAGPEGELLSGPLAVSPDDAWIACDGDEGRVLCFSVATKKATVVTLKDATHKGVVFALTFSPSGKLFVCRGGNAPEVPKGKDEKDVPAERRGIVRIDLPEGKVVPLNMGHTFGTSNCAVDGTETWLATVGASWPDKKPEGEFVGELRVYNLASGKLAYREQMKEERPGWVWFTPSGKRLVCVTSDGRVRWWDVPKP